jgi:DNA invertase Pin-like site-specific DNA recombinase
MREYAARRGWAIAIQVREVGSGAVQRQAREKLLEAARRREIDVVLVWRLDRWGRSVTDLLATLQELEHLGVGFVSLTEALDLTTPAGRAMAGLLPVFAEFEREILGERTRAGLAHARQNGKRLGRPETAGLQADKVRKLHCAGISKSEIARQLHIGRTSVRRIIAGRTENNG